MKVFGFEISVRRASDRGSSAVSQFLEVFTDSKSEKPAFLRRSKNGYARIILPAFDTNNPFLCGRMQHLAEKLQKMFARGWVDVTVVSDIVSTLSLCQTSQTMECTEQLRLIHCVDFRHLDPGLVERIPFMINHIFSEGQLPDHNTPEYDELVQSLVI